MIVTKTDTEHGRRSPIWRHYNMLILNYDIINNQVHVTYERFHGDADLQPTHLHLFRKNSACFRCFICEAYCMHYFWVIP